MAFNVITIARTLGAGGEEVAAHVAKTLDYRYLDEEIILIAAQKAGVSPEMVADAEQQKPLLVRILESMGRTAVMSEGTGATYSPVMSEVLVSPSAERFEPLIVDVVREAAEEGDAVIVAHGAAIPLAGKPGVLRVLITASQEVRSQRVAKSGGMDEKKAAKAVEDSDKQRRDYLKRFYNVEESPSRYDIVLNTEVLGSDRAAEIILAVAKR